MKLHPLQSGDWVVIGGRRVLVCACGDGRVTLGEETPADAGAPESAALLKTFTDYMEVQTYAAVLRSGQGMEVRCLRGREGENPPVWGLYIPWPEARAEGGGS